MSEESRKEPTLSNGPGHMVDKDPPAPSTLPEERDKPGMDEKKRGDLGASKATLHTADTDVGHKL